LRPHPTADSDCDCTYSVRGSGRQDGTPCARTDRRDRRDRAQGDENRTQSGHHFWVLRDEMVQGLSSVYKPHWRVGDGGDGYVGTPMVNAKIGEQRQRYTQSVVPDRGLRPPPDGKAPPSVLDFTGMGRSTVLSSFRRAIQSEFFDGTGGASRSSIDSSSSFFLVTHQPDDFFRILSVSLAFASMSPVPYSISQISQCVGKTVSGTHIPCYAWQGCISSNSTDTSLRASLP
jgi:hypothetical protein